MTSSSDERDSQSPADEEFNYKCVSVKRSIVDMTVRDTLDKNSVYRCINDFNFGLLKSPDARDRRLALLYASSLMSLLIKKHSLSRTSKLLEPLRGPFYQKGSLIFLTFEPEIHEKSYSYILQKTHSPNYQEQNQENLTFSYLLNCLNSDKKKCIGISQPRILDLLSNPALINCFPDPQTECIFFNLKQGNRPQPLGLSFVQIGYEEWIKDFYSPEYKNQGTILVPFLKNHNGLNLHHWIQNESEQKDLLETFILDGVSFKSVKQVRIPSRNSISISNEDSNDEEIKTLQFQENQKKVKDESPGKSGFYHLLSKKLLGSPKAGSKNETEITLKSPSKDLKFKIGVKLKSELGDKSGLKIDHLNHLSLRPQSSTRISGATRSILGASTISSSSKDQKGRFIVKSRLRSSSPAGIVVPVKGTLQNSKVLHSNLNFEKSSVKKNSKEGSKKPKETKFTGELQDSKVSQAQSINPGGFLNQTFVGKEPQEHHFFKIIKKRPAKTECPTVTPKVCINCSQILK